jgi:hypothetical protein
MLESSAVVDVQIRKRPDGNTSVGNLGKTPYLVIGQTVRNIQMTKYILGIYFPIHNQKYKQYETEIFA